MIDKWPELWPGLDIYLAAFYELCSDRPQGMVASPIPFTSVCKYAEFFGFDNDQFEDLLFFTRALDETYREFQEDQKGKPPAKDGMINF